MTVQVQVARPQSDDSAGQWTPTPLFQQLKGISPNNALPVTSGAGVLLDSFTVKLSALARPSSGDQILTVSLGQIGSDNVLSTVSLIQGANTIITAKTFHPGSTFGNNIMILTDEEKASITNYKDLHVQVTAGGPLVSCCPNPVPTVLNATVSSSCSMISGVSFRLTYRGLNGIGRHFWQADLVSSVPGYQNSFVLTCTDSGWQLSQATVICYEFGDSEGGGGLVQQKCSPFQLTLKPRSLTPAAADLVQRVRLSLA